MVTKKPKGLGRGLEALLGPKVEDAPATANAETGLPSQLNVDQMVAGVYQPRTRMDEGALYELAESIKAQGIMQPILVRRLSDADAELKRSQQSPDYSGGTGAGGGALLSARSWAASASSKVKA